MQASEQAEHLQRRNEILSAMGQRAQQGDNRYTNGRGDTVSPLKTTSALAAELGIGKR